MISVANTSKALPELLPNKWRHSAIVLADVVCHELPLSSVA